MDDSEESRQMDESDETKSRMMEDEDTKSKALSLHESCIDEPDQNKTRTLDWEIKHALQDGEHALQDGDNDTEPTNKDSPDNSTEQIKQERKYSRTPNNKTDVNKSNKFKNQDDGATKPRKRKRSSLARLFGFGRDDEDEQYPERPENRRKSFAGKEHPMVRAGIISKVLFMWVLPLLRRGSKYDLEVGDMYKVTREDSATHLATKLEKAWNEEIKKSKRKNRKPSLTRALFKVFGLQFCLLGLIAFLEEVARSISPLFVSLITRYFYKEGNITSQEAYLCAMGISLCSIGLLICHHPYFFHMNRLGMRVRVATSALLYRKVHARLLPVFAITKLLTYFSDGGGISTPEAYAYATFYSISNAIPRYAYHIQAWKHVVIGMRMRIACTGLIYRKIHARLLPVFAITKLLTYFSDGGSISTPEAYAYAAFYSISNAIPRYMYHINAWKHSMIGMRIRIACTGLTYRKCILMIVQPIFVAQITAHLSKESPSSIALYSYAGALSFSSILMRIAGHMYHFHTSRLGMNTRVCVSAYLYRKSILMIVQPLFIAQITAQFSKESSSTRKALYGYAGALSVCTIISFTIGHRLNFDFDRLGMKLRVCVTAFLYRKSLRLSGVALGQTTVGQIVNILSNDVNRFDLGVIFLHYLWIAPLQLAIVLGLLWPAFGPYSLLGLIIFCLLCPLQAYMGRLFSKLRAKTALLTDERVRIMNEIISGMRVVKIYTWEKPFEQLVKIARRKEIRKVMQASYLRAFNLAFYFSSTNIIAYLTFVTYSLTGNPLLPTKVFLAIPLYNVLRLTLLLFTPYAVMNGMEARISVRRIQKFLELEELETTRPANAPNGDLHLNNIMISDPEDIKDIQEKTKDSNEGITVTNLTSSWETEEDATPTLEDISFRVAPGELLAVIGPVGSGKSSLLMALLGEMPNQTGSVSIKGKIGYTAQQPWVFSGTLRNNVLFGQPYDRYRYERAIKNCALKKDLEQLPDADYTLVGERGVTLSGGQRARVSLARAVYNNADVYLLDDPLSAVDTTVGRQLFDQCITGLLSHKPVILVTHQLQYLHSADKIMILKAGRATIGTYEELEQSGVDFASLLKERKKEGKDDEENGENSFVPRKRTISDTGSAWSLGSSIADPERQRLMETQTSTGEEEDEDLGQVSGEEKAVGSIGIKVYMRYFLAGCGGIVFSFFFFINLVAQASINVADWWLAEWTYAEENALRNNSSPDVDQPTSMPEEDFDPLFYIWIYTCLILCVACFTFTRTFMLYHIMVKASKNLHNLMFNSIIRAPMQFFDTNPVGRILNRFAKDIGFMDELLPTTMTDFNQISLMVLGVVIFICVLNPMVILFTLPLIVIFVFVRKFFLKTSRDIKRLEGITRSPVFSHLSASLHGLSTVRAFHAQDKFCEIFDSHQDLHTQAWFLFLSTTRWFGVVIDSLSAIFVIGVSFSCIVAADVFQLDSGIVGLSLTYALSLMGAFQWGVRQSAEVENQMTSTERVLQYVDLESEAAVETDFKPGPEWPKYGLITLEGTSLRYSEDGPDVLQRLYACIRAKEKVGVVGRTGAGKSSLMTALMRLAEPSGTVMIDGVDIKTMGLGVLRQKLSFIPQDPVLFSGTLRKNLDPFEDHTDMDLWRSLEEVQLKADIECLENGLHTKMAEGGTNFSVGQRQLVCLARAIIRRNKILIVDEATANVDLRTDKLIQKTIRERFRHCTVLTVAHRLNTVMDSDRIMVLDTGKIMEFDQPYLLLQKEDGHLTKMVLEAGKSEAGHLIEIAKKKYDENNVDDLYGVHIKDSERSHLSSFIPSSGYRALNIETSM